MSRLYVDGARLGSDVVVLDGDDHHYLTRVLRLASGHKVTLFDGQGGEATAEVGRVGPRAVELRVLERHRSSAGPTLDVTLLQGLAKADKIDLVVQKATELGVARVVPVVTSRAVERLVADRASSRVSRWARIAREAARQCGRADVPEVKSPIAFANAVETAAPDALKLLFFEGARTTSLREALDLVVRPARVVVAIGPEGGFTDDEVETARAAGFAIVGMGPRILRTETAAMAALTIVGYALGDLAGEAPREALSRP